MKSTLNVYILIFFLRGARINGRGQFAASVVERRSSGLALSPTYEESPRKRENRQTRLCRDIYLYAVIGRERDRAVKFSAGRVCVAGRTIPGDLLVSD